MPSQYLSTFNKKLITNLDIITLIYNFIKLIILAFFFTAINKTLHNKRLKEKLMNINS